MIWETPQEMIEFPYRVKIDVIYGLKHPGAISHPVNIWLSSLGPEYGVWVHVDYSVKRFKYEADATAFKLRFGV